MSNIRAIGNSTRSYDFTKPCNMYGKLCKVFWAMLGRLLPYKSTESRLTEHEISLKMIAIYECWWKTYSISELTNIPVSCIYQINQLHGFTKTYNALFGNQHFDWSQFWIWIWEGNKTKKSNLSNIMVSNSYHITKDQPSNKFEVF